MGERTTGGPVRRLLLMLSLLAIALVPSSAAAQVYVGAQGNWSDRYDWGIGGRVTLDLTPKFIPLMIAGSYEYFWPGETLTRDFDYWEVNVNALFVQRVYGAAARAHASGYFGVGLNLSHPTATVKGTGESTSETDVGVNILAGTKYRTGRVAPYFDIGFTLWGPEHFKITFGIDVALDRDF
jgi:hypothetical protein